MSNININIDYETRDIKVNNKTEQTKKYPNDLLMAIRHNSKGIKEELEKDGLKLKDVIEKTEELCMIAVKQNEKALQYVPIELQTINICITAMYFHMNIGILDYIIDEKKREIVRSIYENNKQYAKDFYDVKHNKRSLKTVNQQSEEMCLLAVKKNGSELIHVKDQTLEICMEAVKENPWVLKYVERHYQIEEICWCAIKQDVDTIKFIKDKTPEMCLYVVKNNGGTLRHIKKKYQTEDICLAAIENTHIAYSYVENTTYEFRLKAVKKNWKVIELMDEEDRTSLICIEAIKQNLEAFKYIRENSYTIWSQVGNYLYESSYK